jgi:hypothetical protein
MNSSALVTLLLGLIDRAATISAVIQKARSENRDVTAAELDSLVVEDMVARQKLVNAIAAAKGVAAP